MRADFSRWSFDLPESRRKHYAGVLHQQGRVWLDADWNEEVIARIVHDQQTLRDVIGCCGAPAPGTAFAISPNKDHGDDFLISGGPGPRGHYYVQGILAQLDKSISFKHQPDFPLAELPFNLKAGDEQYGLVFLEVWRRLISFLEDDSLLEIALDGPDTTTRLKTVAQVRVAPLSGKVTCEQASKLIDPNGHGTLSTVQKTSATPPADPCRLPDDVNYSGRDNRLYRVEIHHPGNVGGAAPFEHKFKLASDAPQGAREILLVDAVKPEQKEDLIRIGRFTITDDNGATESCSLDHIGSVDKTLRLLDPLTQSFLAADNAIATVTGGGHSAKVVLDTVDIPAGSLTLPLKDALNQDEFEATKNLKMISVVDRRGRIVDLKLDKVSDDHKTLHLADAIPIEFKKADEPQVVLATARYKWSRNNAASAVSVVGIDKIDRTKLTLSSLGRDQVTRLHAGDWVEISDDVSELGSSRGFLTWLDTEPDPDQLTVQLGIKLPPKFEIDPKTGACRHHLVLRHWDDTGFASATESELNDGVRIKFSGHDLRVGEYWQFTARTNGSVEKLENAKPLGIRRYRCPLAVVRWSRPAWTQAEATTKLKDAGVETPKGLEDRLKQLELIGVDKLTRNDVLAVAENSGISAANLKKLKTALEENVPADLPNLHLEILQDCRQTFVPATELGRPTLEYVGGDGQESDPDGVLAQEIRVAVLRFGKPVPDGTKVRFRIVGSQGELKGKVEPASQDILVPTEQGVAACTWKLEAEPKPGGKLPPRVQFVEASFGSTIPIQFNATLGIWTFNFMGGDGQVADEKFKAPAPLQLTVFKGLEPVSKAQVQFKILDEPPGTPLGGSLNDKAGTALPPGGIALTDDNGIAECFWTLDSTKPGLTQTVEARLLTTAKTPVLQPIHFHARIEFKKPDDGMTIAAVTHSDSAQPLKNDRFIRPSQLIPGVDLDLKRAIPAEVLSRATCFVTVDVPTRVLGVPGGGWGNDVYFPLVLKADVKPTTAGNGIHWEPIDDSITFLKALDETAVPLLARLTVQGNLIHDGTSLYLDGDSFVADGKSKAIRFPSGDGRAGGDFRMWFWLDRKRIDVSPFGFPSVTRGSGEKVVLVTLSNTADQPIQHAKVTIDGPLFSVRAPAGTPFNLLDFELQKASPKTIEVVFDSNGVTTAGAHQIKRTLKITADDLRDCFETETTADVNA